MSKEKSDFKKQMKETTTVEELKAFEKKAGSYNFSKEYQKHLTKLEEGEKNIDKTAAKASKDAKTAGADGTTQADLDAANKEFKLKAKNTVEYAKGKMAKVVQEAGTDEGARGVEPVPVAVSAEAAELLGEAKEGDGEKAPGRTGMTTKEILDSSGNAVVASHVEAEIQAGVPEVPPQPDAAAEKREQLEQNLEVARAAFFDVYQELENSTGRKDKIGRFIWGEDKNKDGLFNSAEENNPGIHEKYWQADEAYQALLLEKANGMLEEGQPQSEVQKMFYTELKSKQESLDPIIPEKVRNILSEGAAYYTRMPKPVRMVASTILATGILAASGKIAIGGALAYGGTKLTKSIVGGLVGQGLVSLKNKFWSAEKDIAKIKEKTEASMVEQLNQNQENPGPLLTGDIVRKMQETYQKQLDAEYKAQVKHLAVDFGIRMITGLAASWGVSKSGLDTGLGKMLSHGPSAPHITPPGDINPNHLPESVDPAHAMDRFHENMGIKPLEPINLDHPVDAHGAALHGGAAQGATEHLAPEIKYDIREIPEIKVSSAGGLQTALDMQRAIKHAYEGVDINDATKIPPSYFHILHTDHVTLAKEMDWYRPGDANESVNILKGSTINFSNPVDDSKEVFIHNLKDIHGSVNEHTLVTDSGAFQKDLDERYFHAQAPVAPVAPIAGAPTGVAPAGVSHEDIHTFGVKPGGAHIDQMANAQTGLKAAHELGNHGVTGGAATAAPAASGESGYTGGAHDNHDTYVDEKGHSMRWWKHHGAKGWEAEHHHGHHTSGGEHPQSQDNLPYQRPHGQGYNQNQRPLYQPYRPTYNTRGPVASQEEYPGSDPLARTYPGASHPYGGNGPKISQGIVYQPAGVSDHFYRSYQGYNGGEPPVITRDTWQSNTDYLFNDRDGFMVNHAMDQNYNFYRYVLRVAAETGLTPNPGESYEHFLARAEQYR